MTQGVIWSIIIFFHVSTAQLKMIEFQTFKFITWITKKTPVFWGRARLIGGMPWNLTWNNILLIPMPTFCFSWIFKEIIILKCNNWQIFVGYIYWSCLKYILLCQILVYESNLLRKRMPTIFFNNFTVTVLSLRKNNGLEYPDRKTLTVCVLSTVVYDCFWLISI